MPDASGLIESRDLDRDRDSHDRDKDKDLVNVHCDYISADEPIHQKFPSSTLLIAVKDWARAEFVPNPPSDKTFYLNDDKTRHRFTPEEEQQSLSQLGYRREAKFRLNEEQIAGVQRASRWPL